MAGDTQITVIGNLTDDPELRFTPSGAAVCNFAVASTPRKFNRDTQEWEDGDAMFLRCSVWRQYAENVAESLQKGMQVMVQGNLRCRPYETREGEKRYSWEVDVTEIGPTLRFATAKVTRTARPGGGAHDSGRPDSGGAPANDPWGAPAGQNGGQGAGQGGRANDPWAGGDEPPF